MSTNTVDSSMYKRVLLYFSRIHGRGVYSACCVADMEIFLFAIPYSCAYYVIGQRQQASDTGLRLKSWAVTLRTGFLTFKLRMQMHAGF